MVAKNFDLSQYYFQCIFKSCSFSRYFKCLIPKLCCLQFRGFFNEKCAVLHVYKILTFMNSNATSTFRLVGLRYRHNIIVLYGLHVINHILLFSVSYITSLINMVKVKIYYFLLSLSLSLSIVTKLSPSCGQWENWKKKLL